MKWWMTFIVIAILVINSLGLTTAAAAGECNGPGIAEFGDPAFGAVVIKVNVGESVSSSGGCFGPEFFPGGQGDLNAAWPDHKGKFLSRWANGRAFESVSEFQTAGGSTSAPIAGVCDQSSGMATGPVILEGPGTGKGHAVKLNEGVTRSLSGFTNCWPEASQRALDVDWPDYLGRFQPKAPNAVIEDGGAGAVAPPFGQVTTPIVPSVPGVCSAASATGPVILEGPGSQGQGHTVKVDAGVTRSRSGFTECWPEDSQEALDADWINHVQKYLAKAENAIIEEAGATSVGGSAAVSGTSVCPVDVITGPAIVEGPGSFGQGFLQRLEFGETRGTLNLTQCWVMSEDELNANWPEHKVNFRAKAPNGTIKD